jgi:glutamyl-tRNA synthetase
MRFRFAPSPTGHFHLGNIRTALLAWLQARSEGGRFIVRVEDLDAGRVRPQFLVSQLQDLVCVGLDWDEGPVLGGAREKGALGPYLQSARTHLYDDALRALGDRGLVYECSCSRREIIAAASAPHGPPDEGPAYPGTCRERLVPPIGGSALRFRVPEGPVCFDDAIHGSRCFEPAAEVGDFVIRRKDGVAAYQLAVVVDDAAMKITHVLRGSDLLASTARQILLYRALDLTPPHWAHVPLMVERGGDRLAKRAGSLSVEAVRQRGVEPERLVGWLAYTAGISDRDVEASPSDLIGGFDLARLPREDTPVSIPAWLTRAAEGGAV